MKKLPAVLLFAFHFSFFTICKAQTFYDYNFSPLSTGMNSPGAYVLALAMEDSTQSSHLFAGGHFNMAGGDTAFNVAEWTVTQMGTDEGYWEPMGTGVNNDVCALATFGKYLYAGGKFDTAGGIAASYIASWDTVLHVWDSLPGKLNGNVYALCVFNGNLYAGGDFTMAGTDTVNRIAYWNGSTWSGVGKGFDSGTVFAISPSNDTLYVGGSFIKSNGMMVNHIAKWNGTYWDSLGSGTNNTVYALADQVGSVLVVGGAFTQSGNIFTNYISIYQDYTYRGWGTVGTGTNDTVRALDEGFGAVGEGPVKKQPEQGWGDGNILLVGGNFDIAGGYACHYIAGYYGGWDTIGELNGPVYALANPYEAWDGDTYVGGAFTAANLGSFSDTLNHVGYLFILLNSGNATINNNESLTIYPNPSNGKFTLQIENSQLKMDNENTQIQIYNELGEQVYSKLSIVNCQFSIDLSSQLNGIYLYRIIAENGELIGEGKVIIQK